MKRCGSDLRAEGDLPRHRATTRCRTADSSPSAGPTDSPPREVEDPDVLAVVVGRAARERDAASRPATMRGSMSRTVPGRQPARLGSVAVEGHEPQVRDVVLALDGPAGHDGEGAVRGEVVLLEDDLLAEGFGGGEPGGPAARRGHGASLGSRRRPRTRLYHPTYPDRMITPDRLAIAPEVADALRDGTPGRRPRVHAHQPRAALPAERGGRHRVRGRRPVLGRRAGDGRAQRGPAPRRALRGRPGGPRDRARRAACARSRGPTSGLAIASGEWGATTVAATMIAAEAAGIRGVRDRRHRRRAPRRARRGHARRPRHLRHLGRPRRAGPDAGRRRVRGPQGDPGRAADARVPRDARRAGRVRGDRRGARASTRGGPGSRRPATSRTSRPRPPSSAPTRRWA